MRIGGMTLFGRLDRYVGGLFLAAYATAFLLIVGLTTIVFLATNLDHFEPCPRPMFANLTTTNCRPKPDFAMLQDQYSELDETNNRISLLVIACKVVGVYDRSAEGIQRMLLEGYDNTLIPVDNWAMFAEKGGVKLHRDRVNAPRQRTGDEDVESEVKRRAEREERHRPEGCERRLDHQE